MQCVVFSLLRVPYFRTLQVVMLPILSKIRKEDGIMLYYFLKVLFCHVKSKLTNGMCLAILGLLSQRTGCVDGKRL